jgi:L-ribulose-5-phosphate 3-epimerase
MIMKERNKRHRIGIMQGRLSPLIDGKIQAFPSRTWRDEFPLVNECGFELMEWVLDLTDLEQNPILSSAGRREINALRKQYGVEIPFICCDYFMEYPLHSESVETRCMAHGMLLELMRSCPEVSICGIELPLIGKADIRAQEHADAVIHLLQDLIPLAEKQDIYFLLEVNLPPIAIASLLHKANSNRILINYDTGNSAYWGYNPDEEIRFYGKQIGNIHIKDVTLKDYSVPLGKGEVNFDQIFRLLKETDYLGDFILQTARDNDHVKTAQTFYQFTKRYIERYLT